MDKDQEKALRNLVAQLKSELEIVKLNQDKYMTLFNQIFKDITKMEQKIKEVEKWNMINIVNVKVWMYLRINLENVRNVIKWHLNEVEKWYLRNDIIK